jgi:hypothetical protein
VAVAETLLGRPPAPINSLSVSEYGTETVWLVANEQSSFWKSIDVDSCKPGSGMRRTRCPFSDLSDRIPGPRIQPPSLAGNAFDYSAKLRLNMRTEQLRMHRQAFVYSEGKLASLPLLHDSARFFEGQVASTLGASHIYPCVANRPSVRTLRKVTLSFSSYTSCKFKSHLHTLSNSFHTSGKLSVAPDRPTFNVREELRRLVRNSISPYFFPLSSWTDSSLQCSN